VFQHLGSAWIPLEKDSFGWERSHSCTAYCTPSSDLMPFMNFLVHSHICCSDRHASPYWTFIRRWISMGFNPSLLKKPMTEHCSFWCMLQAGPPSLHYYCAVVLCSCTVLPPVGHFSDHEYYYYYQLTRQLSCVSNFYRAFKVFISIALVLTAG
jgi:hypothetical protein